MKQLLLITLSIFNISCLFSQNHFTISGITNLVSNGKAILRQSGPSGFYSTKIKNDTVNIFNHHFIFEDTLKYPQQFRITLISSDKDYITEGIFIDTGFQKISIDSSSQINNILDFGHAVSMEGSKTNNEYTKKYLPLFDSINKRIVVFLSEIERCDTINDFESKKACVIKTEIERINIRKIRDSILLNYATQYPNSAIIPWLLYEALRKYGYKEFYQTIIDKITNYNPTNINKYLTSFINEQKIKIVGNLFPLNDFINNNFKNKYTKNIKYTLVEFWYSGCGPCIAQFNSLKSVYNKFNKQGFEIVAISIDGKKTLNKYKKILKLNNYPWKQILDIGGKRATSINIQKYPSSFLLNKKGEIISIDIKPEALHDYLKQNL